MKPGIILGIPSKAEVLVKAKGDNMPDPGPSLSEPVVVELVNSETGVCFGAAYSGAEIIKNESHMFKAKAFNP